MNVKLENVEKIQLKSLLMNKVDSFIGELPDDNHLGWIPDNTVELMTEAAFAVLMAINDTNIYMEEQELLK